MQSHTKKPDHNIRANDMDITSNAEAFTHSNANQTLQFLHELS